MKRALLRTALYLSPALVVFSVMRSQEIAAGSHRVSQFDNAAVRVWRSVIVPGAPLTLHRHEHPRVLVALRGGMVDIQQQGGPSERHVWETGKAYWLPANAPGTLHVDVNAGKEPIEVMVIELQNER